MGYDGELMEQICERVDLLEYVGQSIRMRKRGSDYFGSCPMHVDKTPSFSITPSKNLFYCFSCGRSGNIVNYLMEYEGLGRQDAIQKAASLAGIDASKHCGTSGTRRFLMEVRRASAPRREEPAPREVLDESVMDGFERRDAEEWVAEGISPEVMERFGVRIDARSNRIVYPVRDADGRLVNVKGRTRYPNYKELGIPKYINYYKVGRMDYLQGLDVTMPFVREKGEAIIFESVKSVMKAYGWGYRNAASAERHGLTGEQLELLMRLRVDVVLAYDSDVDYWRGGVAADIRRLKRITNVYVIEDAGHLLGGAEAKNAPVDMGREVWERLYASRRKVG